MPAEEITCKTGVRGLPMEPQWGIQPNLARIPRKGDM